MTFLMTLCGLITWAIIYETFTTKDRSESSWKRYKTSGKIGAIVAIIVFAWLTLTFASSVFSISTSSNKWDKLSKEEKEWYQDNYGNGKSEAYDDALEDYRGY